MSIHRGPSTAPTPRDHQRTLGVGQSLFGFKQLLLNLSIISKASCSTFRSFSTSARRGLRLQRYVFALGKPALEDLGARGAVWASSYIRQPASARVYFRLPPSWNFVQAALLLCCLEGEARAPAGADGEMLAPLTPSTPRRRDAAEVKAFQ